MFETPRIVPHELVHTEGEAKTETREIDMSRYGYSYDPRSTMRVSQSKEVCGTDNQENDHDQDDVTYGSGGQGAGS